MCISWVSSGATFLQMNYLTVVRGTGSKSDPHYFSCVCVFVQHSNLIFLYILQNDHHKKSS